MLIILFIIIKTLLYDRLYPKLISFFPFIHLFFKFTLTFLWFKSTCFNIVIVQINLTMLIWSHIFIVLDQRRIMHWTVVIGLLLVSCFISNQSIVDYFPSGWNWLALFIKSIGVYGWLHLRAKGIGRIDLLALVAIVAA